MVEVGTSTASITPLQIRVRFRPEAWVLGGGALKPCAGFLVWTNNTSWMIFISDGSLAFVAFSMGWVDDTW